MLLKRIYLKIRPMVTIIGRICCFRKHRYFRIEALYSLGVMLVMRLKHLEKYWGLS